MPNFQLWKEKINFNTVVAIILIVFSIVTFFLIPYQIEKPKLFMGRSLSSLTPSLFPRLGVIALFIFSLWYLFNSTKIKEKNLFRDLNPRNIVRILVTTVVCAGYALSFEPLGFVLSSALVVGLLSTYYGNRNIFVALLVTAGAPLAIYFIFTHALRVSLPEGPLF